MGTLAVVQIDIQTPDLPELDRQRRNDKLILESVNQFREYSKKVGADYYILTHPAYPHLHPQLELFRVLSMDYDLVLTVDTDVLINKHEDIFEQCHPTRLSACHRPDGGEHINSGVLVWGREARDWYGKNINMQRAANFKNRDQDEINYLNPHFPATRISSRFNDYTFQPDSYFHHYKGGSKNDFSSRQCELPL